MKKPLIVLTGPTAVGKTELSIQLAKKVNGEIISADSMQVYKYMNIGTAKITPDEMQGIPHYLVDEILPDEEFNVVIFQQLAKKYMEEIYNKGKIPILVGGTGFYIQAVLKNINFTETDTNLEYRSELENIAKEKGSAFLHEMLQNVDKKAADSIHENNTKRIIRALEFYKETKKLISEHNEEEYLKESPYNFAYFVLNTERGLLYERINLRIDKMLEEGLVKEVEMLAKMGMKKDMVSMQGLGYKEILSYLNREISLEEAVYLLKRDTRRFAKRQLTWFRREKNITWIEKEHFDFNNDKILSYMLNFIKATEII
ncbi:tRNA (adenosine(37)-N6)-dimethylallyltransferase MiaA [Anaerosacchariphilus polymeriproducens]|uniref:tRNA dimethylallyltransferase n=1 Tax=Anaerosacchariphilus polymeriproducens TaxID=1812858 RepID=A0A371AUK3_9FIRM|nr:tRNA (adenosine(37)-N6)-dimethylallyltransferase MiaA [Anaerosacchariphilus polymeriproducens]RDU23170.1 tRNA (adenosine(37)-N6)-dimethylallyltransferase MiaA [Anaerosacchariphilus polymeriproducens]